MDTPLKIYLRAWWPQWVPGVIAATGTVWALWGLPFALVAAIALATGGLTFLFFSFAGMAADWR
ncbi:MAG: hypothetical protein RPU52_14830 [Candidatus Sedimenticola sp. (ex Thyasira tokunagai)]